jgi:thioesterase domain-containing protein
VFPYRSLAAALDSEASVVGVQAPEFAGMPAAYGSSPELIALYVRAILRAQPMGPYRLAGWSLGGAIAVGVAHQLELIGHRVAFLGLVDCFIPSLAERERWNNAEQEREITDSLAALRARLRRAGAEAPSVSAARELGLGARVFRRLSDLANEIALQPVRVAPSCWWSAEVDEVGLEHAQREPDSLVGARARCCRRIEDTHRGILEHGSFHASFRAELTNSALAANTELTPLEFRQFP